VHGFFAKTSNVKIGWAVNSVSVPQTAENQIDRYYPGDAYVDIVGVDGFNMGDPWLSFDQIFNNSLTTVSQYKKPVFLFSFGTAPGPEKAAWLNDALNNQLPKYPLVEGWIYFNQNKERNWLLWSDAKTFEVFTKYISE
jgi:beta-mannanase